MVAAGRAALRSGAAAYALGLAYHETRIRGHGHGRWDDEDVEWVLRLADRCGYRWSAWEEAGVAIGA